jgi:hypothetical protein
MGFGVVDVIADDEEIIGVAHLVDDAELVIQAVEVFLIRIRDSFMEPVKGFFA